MWHVQNHLLGIISHVGRVCCLCIGLYMALQEQCESFYTKKICQVKTVFDKVVSMQSAESSNAHD